MVLSTEWSQVEVIDLINDGHSSGLGFMLVGGRSTGVVIKALIPGGAAERDGRLQCGDHVLQIGDVNLRGFSSEQVATVLRQTGPQVRLIVARPVEPSSPDYQSLATNAPIIPTKLLSDPEELERQLLQTAGYTQAALLAAAAASPTATALVEGLEATVEVIAVVPETASSGGESVRKSSYVSPSTATAPPLHLPSPPPLPDSSPPALITDYLDLPETETYQVELRKNVYGLGITVAGYVCEEEDLSGIFVKSIIEGSAAEMSGKIQINDRIVAVDGKSLSGVTNHQAVEILRNTDIAVNLTLERFLRGRKYEHLQLALTEPQPPTPPSNPPPSNPTSPSITVLPWMPPTDDAGGDVDSIISIDRDPNVIEPELESNTTVDSNIFGIENGRASDDSEATPTPTPSCDSATKRWSNELPDLKIVVAHINKLSGLGISLEGTVEVEGGVEMRPHHYIRSILEEGPVGRDGTLKPGDELLQVNEHRLQGLKHTDVVKVLKELPSTVKLVCARSHKPPSVINTSQSPEAFEARSILAGGLQSLQNLLTKAQSESSLYTSSTATLTDQQRSKSVEQVSGLALWSTEVLYIDIEKTERGFGFSILDYQDPLDPDGTVIVVRGLIPGGSAEVTNLIFPGDRLVSVADHQLHGRTLDEAVSILKGMPTGIIRIGLCRPLSTSDNNVSSAAETPTT
ncbi:patj homolog [Lutzomyia longipalpis]|uniref:patj homolog n=1 Tax=Lutzomyia longipalpis TaxID=7200 RepID=UPI0024840AE1|nr:patj homolog [Lutzomyia longipalpis]